MIRHQGYQIESGEDRTILIKQMDALGDDCETIILYVEQIKKFIDDLLTITTEVLDTEPK